MKFVSERRESEIKARATKEKKEAEMKKEEGKVVPPQKSKPDTESKADKQKRLEIVKAKKLSAESKEVNVQKKENVKSVAKKQTPSSKTQDEGEKRLRPRKIADKSQATDSLPHDDSDYIPEGQADKMGPPSAPRRSLRRGSRDATLSETPSPDPAPRTATNKKSKPLSPSPPRLLKKSSKTPERSPSEDKFSDSDEEPLGKLALKQLSIKKTEETTPEKTKKNETSEKKVLKDEESSGSKVTEDRKKSSLSDNTEKVVKTSPNPAKRNVDKKIDKAKVNTDSTEYVKKKSESEILGKVKEDSPKKVEDDTKNKDKTCRKIEDSHRKDNSNKKNEIKNREIDSKKHEDPKNEKKDIANKKTEESIGKTKETSLKKNEQSAKNRELNKRIEAETLLERKSEAEISPRKSRDVTVSRNKDLAQRKSEEISLKKSEEPASKRKNDETDSKDKEVVTVNFEENKPIKERKSEETKHKEISQKKNETANESEIKNKEIINEETKETFTKKKEVKYSEKKQLKVHSLNEGEVSKRKDSSPKKSEMIPNIVSRKNKVEEFVMKTKRNAQKEAQEQNVASFSGKEDQSKNEGQAFAKTEVTNVKSKEVTNKAEEIRNVKKEISTLSKKSDDTLKRKGEIREPSPRKGDFVQDKKLLHGKNEELIRNSDKFSRKTESNVQNKEIPCKREEMLKNSDKSSRKIEDAQHKELLQRKEILKNVDKCRKTESKIELLVKKSEELNICEKNIESKKSVQDTKTKLSDTLVKSDKNVSTFSEPEVTLKAVKEPIKSRESSPQKDMKITQPKQSSDELLSTKKLPQKSPPQKVPPKITTDSVQVHDDISSGKVKKEFKKVSSSIACNTVLKIPEVPNLPWSEVKESLKHPLDHSDSEDDIVLKKLAKPETFLIKSEVPKHVNLPAKPENSEKFKNVSKLENDSLAATDLPPTSQSVNILTGIKVLNKDHKEVKAESTKIKKVESGPSSQSVGFCSKPDLLLGREKGKTKVNMSNEQIEKWLNESYIDEADAKKDCQMFDKCLDGVSEQQVGEFLSKEPVDLEEGAMLIKQIQLFPTDIGENLYVCDRIVPDLKQKAIEGAKNMKFVTNEGKSPMKLGSPLGIELSSTMQNERISEKTDITVNPDIKVNTLQEIASDGSKLTLETKKHDLNIRQASCSKSQSFQDRSGEKKSIFQQRRSFPHKAKERKDLTPSANAFSPENESSVYAFDTEPELPPISTPFRRRARDSRTSSTTTSKSEEDLARLDDEISPPQSVQPCQTVASTASSPVTQQPSMSLSNFVVQPAPPLTPSQPVLSPTRIDSSPLVKSPQSVSSCTLTQALPLIQSPSPTEPSSPPVQTESVPSSQPPTLTQSIQSTQSLILTQSVPSSPSQLIQTNQQERLPLPVLGQSIQTLPLATAVVQIIPTLPITMRSVPVENYVASSSQQQQQQQQLLLLQNDAMMTTLKSGSTSSTSIAVQVNLDSEAVPEVQLQEPGSMECSTQTDVAEEEEDDSEGHLFYIPLQQPPAGKGGPLAAPSQQLIQGVAVKLGTEGPNGPNQRVIMRAKLVTKPPTFNRAPADTIGR